MRPKRDNNLQLRNFARQLRRTSTDAESKLWLILRSRKLAGHKFRRQYPLAGYIVDFYCVRERLALELDGGQHYDDAARDYDSLRTQRLHDIGVRVIRYPDDEVLRDPDIVADDIYRHLMPELPSPQPSPGVPGEGE
jgi:very-short-patch-repair endonuclease